MNVTFKKIIAIAALFAAAVPFANAQATSETDDLVAELKAQKQRNSEEAQALQQKLDAAYTELDQSLLLHKQSMTAIIVTAVVSGGAVGIVLFFLVRSKNKSQRELMAINAELMKANKELTATLAALKK